MLLKASIIISTVVDRWHRANGWMAIGYQVTVRGHIGSTEAGMQMSMAGGTVTRPAGMLVINGRR